MPQLKYKSTAAGLSRFNTKTEDALDLRQSVSVQMKVRIPDTVHQSDAGLGITLYDLLENPDTFNNVGKKLRILSPTVTGSDPTFRVLLGTDVIASQTCAYLNDTVENLIEYRFWQDVEYFKVQYLMNSVVQATLNIPKSVLSDSLRFKVGVTLSGVVDVNIYTLNINYKNKVAKTVRVQGSGEITLPNGNTAVLLKGTGGPGKFTTFKLNRTATPNVSQFISGTSFVDATPNTSIDLAGIIGENSQCVLINSTLTTADNLSQVANAVTRDMFETIEKILLPTNSAIGPCVVFQDYFYYTYTSYRGVSAVPTNHLYRTKDFISNELVTTNIPFTYFEMGVFFVEGVGDVLMITESGNTAYYLSTDGLTFNLNYQSFAISSKTIVKASDKYIHYLNGGLTIHSSSDLITWTQLTAPTNYTTTNEAPVQFGTKYKYVFGNGILAYKVHNQNKVVYSLNSGETWLEYDHPENFTYLLFGNGQFVLYSAKYINTPSYVTKDFVTVTQSANSSGNLGTLCLFEMNKFISMDVSLGSFKISTDFKTWEDVVSYPRLKPLPEMLYFTLDVLKEHIVLRAVLAASPRRPQIGQQDTAGTTHGILLASSLSVGTSDDGVDGNPVSAVINAQTYAFPTTKTQVVAAPLSRVVSVPSTNAVVQYTAPTDAFLEMTYIDDQYTGPARNEFVRDGCSGLDKVRFYANGAGGEYSEIIAKNSVDCGYVADTLKTVILTGKNKLELAAGLTTVEISGRGSSVIPKTLATTNSLIPVNFDRILNLDIQEINEVAYGNGVYVVLAKTDTETFANSSILRSKEMWVGPTLETLVKVSFTSTYQFSFVNFFKDKFIVQIVDNSSPAFLTCTSGGALESDWTLRPTVGVDFNQRLMVTPTHVLAVVATDYIYSTDGINFTNRSWNNGGNRPHQSIGVLTTNSRVVSYGTTANNNFNGAVGYSWLLHTTADSIETGLVNNQWLENTVDIGYPFGSSDPQVVKDYNDTRLMFEDNVTPARKRGISSLAFGNGRFFGIVGFFYYQDYGLTPTTYNLTNDTAPGFEVVASEQDYSFRCFKSQFTPWATVVFTDGQFVVTDVGRVFTSSTGLRGSWTEVTLDPVLKNQIRSAYTNENKIYYNCKLPGIVYSSKKYPGDQYVTKLASRGQDAVVGVDKTIIVLAGNKTTTDPATIITENITLNPGQETTIVYDCPPGSLVSVKYMSVNDNAPAAGTQLTTVCDGFNKLGVYANGAGGTYESLLTANSPDCGWQPPVLRANVHYPASLAIVELENKSLTYTLSSVLDVPVGFVFGMYYGGGATEQDFQNFQVKIGAAEPLPLYTDEEIIIPAGVTSFTISFGAYEDYKNEPLETSYVILTPQTNSGRIINTTLSTTVDMTSNNTAVEVDPFDNYNEDKINTVVYSDKPGAGYTNHQKVVRSTASVTTGSYAVEILNISHANGIVGFVTNASLGYNAGQHVYPGYDALSWGFSSSGNYHNGSVVSTGPAWTKDTKLTLLYNADTGVAEMLVDYQHVGNIISGISGSIHLAVGSIVPNKTTSFYINIGQIAFQPSPPGIIPFEYNLGFGRLINATYWAPEYSPAVGSFNMTPSGLTGQSGGVVQSGIVFAHSQYRPQTVNTINDGTGVVEIQLLSKDPIRIGIHPSNFTLTAGSSNNSWAVISDGTAVIHDGVVTNLQAPAQPTTIITLVFNLLLGRVDVYFGTNLHYTFNNVPTQSNLVVSVESTTTMANGGTLVFVNCGQSEYLNYIQNVVNAFGVFNASPANGTYLSSYCSGTDLFAMRADGNGGTYSELYRQNSTVCGYTPPPNEQSGWAYELKGDNVTYNQTGMNVAFTGQAALLGSKEVSSGKYYWEVRSDDVFVGVGPSNLNTNSDILQSDQIFVVSMRDGYSITDGTWGGSVSQYYYTNFYGMWVGFMLDLDERKLYVRFQDETVHEVTGFNTSLVPTAVRPLLFNTSATVIDAQVNLGQEPFYNPLPAGYISWFTVQEPPAYYLDDFVNNNKNFIGTKFEDFYRPTFSDSLVTLDVNYVNTPGAGYLSMRKPDFETNTTYWTWPYSPPMLNNFTATFDFEVPEQIIYRNGNYVIEQFDYVPLTDGTEEYTDCMFQFSVYTSNSAIVNAPIEVAITYPGTFNRISTIRGGVGYAFAGPSPRRNSGTQVPITIPPAVSRKFVIEVFDNFDQGHKSSRVYLNDQLLGVVVHETIAIGQLVSVAVLTDRVMQSNEGLHPEVRLKKIRFDETV